MTTVLRPMSTGEVLDRTFSLYRNNFVLFFGISTLPPAMGLLMQLVIYGAGKVDVGTSAGGRTASIVIAAVGVLLGVLAYFIGLAFAQGATIYAVSAVHLDRATTIRESYGRLRGHYGRVLNVVLSWAIRVFGGGFVLFLGAILSFALVPGLRTFIGMGGIILGAVIGLAALVLAVVLFFMLLVRYALAVPVCVLEDIKARAAMKRSVALSKGSRGRIFVIYFLFIVLQMVITYALLIPLGVMAVTAKGTSLIIVTISTHLVSFLVGALLGPVITIAMSLVYYDERVRKEAFDIELMMAAIDGPQPPQVAGAPAGNIG